MALSNGEISRVISQSRLSVASSCICRPVSILMRRMTFTSSQRLWMVSGRSSENTSTTNRSGGDEPRSAGSGDGIGNIFLGELMAARPIQPLVRCRATHWGNLRKCSVFFTCQWPNVQGRTGGWSVKAQWHCGTVGPKCGTPIHLYCGRLHRLVPFWAKGFRSACLADYLHYQWLWRCEHGPKQPGSHPGVEARN